MTTAEYRAVLDPIVRPDLFRRDPSILIHLAIHLAIVIGLGILTARNIHTWHPALILALAIVSGHSVGMAAFSAHEIGHGSVLPAGKRRYIAEWLWLDILLLRHAHDPAEGPQRHSPPLRQHRSRGCSRTAPTRSSAPS